MLVATPSGITLGPEGGAHQSINTPLIGMAQDGLSYFEPAYADELAAIMSWGLRHMQDDNGGSVYLRLSTRQLEQPKREMDEALATTSSKAATGCAAPTRPPNSQSPTPAPWRRRRCRRSLG